MIVLKNYIINTTIVLHEVAHSQHFQRIRSDKGFWGASNWWSALVFNETRHTAATFGQNYYGSKGDVGWGYIALAEGWANYREFRLTEAVTSGTSSYPKNYAHMFHQLNSIGCSNVNMEKCLVATTISEFKDKLLSVYGYNSSMQNSIRQITSQYE